MLMMMGRKNENRKGIKIAAGLHWISLHSIFKLLGIHIISYLIWLGYKNQANKIVHIALIYSKGMLRGLLHNHKIT